VKRKQTLRIWLLLLSVLLISGLLFACALGGDDDDDDDDAGDDDSGDDDDDSANEPPVIEHTPLGDQGEGFGPYRVDADVTDDAEVASASLFYRRTDEADFTEVEMTPRGEGACYAADIPDMTAGAGVLYYIQAEDDQGAQAFHPAGAPEELHSFNVLYAFLLTYDDGLAEDAIRGVGAQSQVMVGYVPSVYPVLVGRVEAYINADPINAGKKVRAVVYSDPAGTGPSADNLLFTSDETEVVETDSILKVDVSSGGIQIDAGGFIVGLENTDDRGPWIGLDETTFYTGNSWYYDIGDASYFNLSDTEFAYNAMISVVILIP